MTLIPDKYLRLMSPEDRKQLGKAGETFAEATERGSILTERKLQAQIESWFRKNEIYAERQRMDRKSNMTGGAPDFRVCFEGRFVAFEIKVGANHATPEQERELERIRLSGGLAYVVRSLVEIKEILGKL